MAGNGPKTITLRGIILTNIAKTTRQSRVNFAICMVDATVADLLEVYLSPDNTNPSLITKDKLLHMFKIKSQMFMQCISEKHEKELQAIGVEHFQNCWSRIFK